MKKLWNKKWFKVLVIFLPFTGIINPYWYYLLLFVYIGVGSVYAFKSDNNKSNSGGGYKKEDKPPIQYPDGKPDDSNLVDDSEGGNNPPQL